MHKRRALETQRNAGQSFRLQGFRTYDLIDLFSGHGLRQISELKRKKVSEHRIFTSETQLKTILLCIRAFQNKYYLATFVFGVWQRHSSLVVPVIRDLCKSVSRDRQRKAWAWSGCISKHIARLVSQSSTQLRTLRESLTYLESMVSYQHCLGLLLRGRTWRNRVVEMRDSRITAKNIRSQCSEFGKMTFGRCEKNETQLCVTYS